MISEFYIYKTKLPAKLTNLNKIEFSKEGTTVWGSLVEISFQSQYKKEVHLFPRTPVATSSRDLNTFVPFSNAVFVKNLETFTVC